MKKIIALVISVIAFGVVAHAQTNIKNVDFENFTFVIGKETVKIKDGLQTGVCQKKSEDDIPEGQIWSVSKDSIVYGDVYGDSGLEAIVPIAANVCGGNMVTNEAVLVYTIQNGKTVKLPEFDYFDSGCEENKPCGWTRSGGVSVEYDAKEKSVVIVTSFATDDDAICCPSMFRKTNYKWDEPAFVETKKSAITKRKEGED